MKKRRVLFLARRAHPDIGGIEKHLLHLTKELENKGCQVEVLTEKSLLSTIRPSGLHKLDIWLAITQHWSKFKNADIIHIHDVFWWVLPIWPLIAHKTYMTFHGYEGSEAPNWKQVFWHRLGALMTRGNIAIGDFHHKWYGVKSNIVSYGAVEKVKPQKKSAQQYTFIGRLHADNGILDYLESFAKFNQNNPQAKLEIYGDGPLKKECQKFVKKNKVNANIHGFIKNADQKLQLTKVAFVSRYLAILESLSAGVPVIAHYNNQIKHDYLALAPFAKWITLVSSPAEVSQALEKIKPLKKEAQAWAQEQTWSKMADNYLKLWKFK